jgi:hypothetical protein
MIKESSMPIASTVASPAAAPVRPWYSHRWPWFLMIGPVVVLVGGGVAGSLALSRPDAMVVDDYYKQGKAINQDLRRDRAATALAIAFEASYDAGTGGLSGVVTSGGAPLQAPLHIYLAHPTQPGKDLQLLARPGSDGRFAVPVAKLEATHWQVVVEGARREWRVARSWSWPRESALAIHADAPTATAP